MYIVWASFPRPHLNLFLFALYLPCLKTLGRQVGFFYELPYYESFLVKGVRYNLVKATHNYSFILCFAVLEQLRTKYPIGEEGHSLDENTILFRENII